MSSNPIFSYTHRDYEGSRKEGISRIPILSEGKWTDMNASDPGIIILDYAHALADMISYYQDHQALETFISTAKERANIFRLAKQLSYKILSAKGAIVEVEFSTAIAYDYPVKIPKYTTVSTDTGISYLTTEDNYLPTRTDHIIVECTQGALYEYQYRGTGISRYSDVEGAENQYIHLTIDHIDIDSIEVIENKGEVTERLWKPVDYIVFSNPTDRVYQVELNPDNTVSILFGDGVRGYVPRIEDNLTVQYVASLADEGRIGAREIIHLDTPIIDADDSYIDFVVTNSKPSTGGTVAQYSSEIRDLAPGAIKAQDRAVTLSDFENLAKLVPGVASATAYDINLKPDLCLYHEVKVLIVPKDISGDTELLVSKVREYLLARIIPPTNLQVFTPTSVSVNITVDIQLLDGASESRIEYSVRNRIENYFKQVPAGVGEDFYSSDLYNELRDIEGVRKILNITPSSQYIEELSFATLGEIRVNFK